MTTVKMYVRIGLRVYKCGSRTSVSARTPVHWTPVQFNFVHCTAGQKETPVNVCPPGYV
jgi:hypothetical protein